VLGFGKIRMMTESVEHEFKRDFMKHAADTSVVLIHQPSEFKEK